LVIDALEEGIEKGILRNEDVTLQRLEGFFSEFGRKFYKVTDKSNERIVLQRTAEPIEESLTNSDNSIEVIPFRRGKPTWRAQWK
jgi:dihydroorotase